MTRAEFQEIQSFRRQIKRRAPRLYSMVWERLSDSQFYNIWLDYLQKLQESTGQRMHVLIVINGLEHEIGSFVVQSERVLN